MTDRPVRRAVPTRTAPASVRRTLSWLRPGLRDLTPGLPVADGLPATEIQAREWTFVLTARGIPHTLRRQGGGWRLYVPRRRAEEALAEIQAYRAERENIVLPDPGAVSRPPSVVWPVLAIMGIVSGCWGLLLGGAMVWGRRVVFRDSGGGDTAAMLAGQWWRAATALTLHADPAHLCGNALSAALFLSLLCRETGIGLGLALAVGAGIGGNLLKALIQGPGLYFLGASTAVFGALGALGGVRLAGERPPHCMRRFVTVGAVLMLLAMLGAGSEDTGTVDLAGHLFGFLSGLALGLLSGWGLTRLGRPGFSVQVVLGLLAAGLLAGGWGLALAGLPGRG